MKLSLRAMFMLVAVMALLCWACTTWPVTESVVVFADNPSTPGIATPLPNPVIAHRPPTAGEAALRLWIGTAVAASLFGFGALAMRSLRVKKPISN